MSMKNKVIEGLKPAPGTARLVLSRWIVAILGALPGILVGQSAIGKVLGRQPWLTEAPDPLPIVQLGVLTGDMPPAMMGALAVGVLLAWLANQMLTAGAIEILDPNRPAGELRIWRKVIDTGSQFLLPFLRISLLALILGGAGTVLIGKIFRMIKDHGEVARWTGETMIFTLGITRFLLVLAWVALVGALSWWCKVILVADERRFVRRMAAVLPRAAWRRPMQGVLIHWFLGIASVLLAGLVLAFWRISGQRAALVLLMAGRLAGTGLRLALATAHLWDALGGPGARRLARAPGRALARLPQATRPLSPPMAGRQPVRRLRVGASAPAGCS